MSDCQKTMILENYRFVVAQSVADSIPFICVEYNTGEVIKQRMIFKKST